MRKSGVRVLATSWCEQPVARLAGGAQAWVPGNTGSHARREVIVEYSPTVRGRRLIREAEGLRHDRGLSMEATAQRLGWSVSKLYRLENGKSRITTDDLADMLDLYGVTSPEREALLQLCRDARKRGWWTAYADVFTGSYISMEAEAATIRIHAHVLLPGIFQTPTYARAVITATEAGITPADADRRVAARLARQQALLDRSCPPVVHAILDEAVLRRQVGGPAATAAQLDALAGLTARPHVTVQVLPFTTGANAGLDGKFTLLALPDDPPVAYVEGLMGDIYLEAADETDRFHAAWTRLASQALPPNDSVHIIRQLAQENR
jgi:transcriptional regulator with XRE-family HTH domain